MKTVSLIAGVVLAGAMATSVLADGIVTGAAGGAVTGAVVGGPVGAAIGGVTGAIVGGVIDPPPARVVTYVQDQPITDDSVIVEQPLAVGNTLPGEIEIVPVPENDHYGYAIVNHERVIVQPQTRKVVQVIQ